MSVAKRVFIDTNIIFYALDADSGPKRRAAAALLDAAWNKEVEPIISVQVLQELTYNLRKRIKDDGLAIALVEDYLAWPVIANDLSLFRQGLEAMRDFRISLWDAMIVAAANRGRAEELWTEDLNSGQLYGSVRVVNPLT